jgi:hypothetical protein
MRRIELLQPKKDLERLKKMTEGTSKQETVPVKKTSRKAPKVPSFLTFLTLFSQERLRKIGFLLKKTRWKRRLKKYLVYQRVM